MNAVCVNRILMVSADNYGSLVDEPSQHPAYIPFIVMVIIVGSMFLLSLLLGVTYDVFIEHTTEQVCSAIYARVRREVFWKMTILFARKVEVYIALL